MSNLPKIYTGILFLPTIGFFLDNSIINQHAHFLLILLLIALSYATYSYQYQKQFLNVTRKCIGCFCTAALIMILSAEVSNILIQVYHVSFAEEIAFTIKMIFMLGNMEGNLQLCTDQILHHKQLGHNHQITPTHVI